AFSPPVPFPPPLSLTFLFFLMIPPPPRSTLFPYTTLFRSRVTRDRLRVALGELGPFGPRSDETHVAAEHVPQLRHLVDARGPERSEEHTSELQSLTNLVCRLLLEKKNNKKTTRDVVPRRLP